MECFHPRLIHNPDPYKVAGYQMFVPCGECPACLSNKREQWAFRLKCELETSNYALFMTYTYEDSQLPILYFSPSTQSFITSSASAPLPVMVGDELKSYVLIRKHWTSYKDVLHNSLLRENIDTRYFMCGEYGSRTYRPHYHAILFFTYDMPYYPPEKIKEYVAKYWHYGNIKFGSVTPASIRYVCKDMIKQVYKNSDYVKLQICHGIKNFAPYYTMSNRPGIGSAWFEKNKNFYNDKIRSATPVVSDGHYVSIPRYFKDKLFPANYKYEINIHTDTSYDLWKVRDVPIEVKFDKFKVNQNIVKKLEKLQEEKRVSLHLSQEEFQKLLQNERKQTEWIRQQRINEKTGKF